jgi:hypothetical protein
MGGGMTERIAYNMWQQDELYPGKLNGSCNYTRTEYDNLTGYLTKEYTTEWQDSSGTRWRKTCRIINLGRPDRGVPVDPEEAIAFDPWREKPSEAIKLGSAQYQARMQYRITEYLRERGPSMTRDIATDLSMVYPTVVKHLAKQDGTVYRRVGKVNHFVIWGLVES